MLVGVDFDNTIVCYDRLFHRLALEQGLIPADLPAAKGPVRDHLRRTGREDAWTEMQGLVYGAHIAEAAPFPGVYDFFRRCRKRGVDVCVISHKTRQPFAGPRYDLHRAAHEWLEWQGFYREAETGLTPERVYFEVLLEGKLKRIGQVGCDYFIDDLPELLEEPGFPAGVERILFDPGGNWPGSGFRRAATWEEVEGLILSSEYRGC